MIEQKKKKNHLYSGIHGDTVSTHLPFFCERSFRNECNPSVCASFLENVADELRDSVRLEHLYVDIQTKQK